GTAQMLAKAGYAVANIDYRLAEAAKFPGAVADCKAAVRWLRSRANGLRIDPDRIGAIGGSAGGHLAAMLATTADGNGDVIPGPDISDAISVAIIMGAGVDQVTRAKETPGIANQLIFFGGTLEEKPEVYAAGSPITHVSPDTAPILMLDGELDRPGQRYPLFRDKLSRAGVPNELVVVPGAKHGQWAKPPFRDGFVSAMLEYLDFYLRGPRPNRIFDGKTLTGWEGDPDWFRVEDGAIIGGHLDRVIPHNYFLATTEDYRNFELRLQVQAVAAEPGKKTNGGIQFRSERVPDTTHVKGYQADVGEGWWGIIYDEHRRRKPLTPKPTPEFEAELLRPGWNDYHIRALDDRIEIWINGIKTADYQEEDQEIAVSTGFIALQVHSSKHPIEISYRDIWLKPLD
ncbi:MAG: family 16 glycoside hydrolase, partial [Verrucomicrobiota bacterium]